MVSLIRQPLAALFLLATAMSGSAQDFSEAEGAVPRDPDRQVFFGNFHVHANYSFDAFANGAVTGPEEAYPWAKGQPIASGGWA